MISNKAFAECVKIPLENKWGYIWGKSGQLWTQEQQERATREQTVKYGKKWIGHRVADCSGLVLWAVKQFGETVFHGSNSQFRKNCSVTGRLVSGAREDGQELKPGTLVFKTKNGDRYHVGVYVGDTVIEAHGTYHGVITSGIEEWDEFGELSCVNYYGGGLSVRVLKRGCSGEDVKQLQDFLNDHGFDCGRADGIFGEKTEDAVKAYQREKGLKADGVAGEETLAAMDGGAPADEPPEALDDVRAKLLSAQTSISQAIEMLGKN